MIDIPYSFLLELIKPMWLVLLHEYCQHMTFSIRIECFRYTIRIVIYAYSLAKDSLVN